MRCKRLCSVPCSLLPGAAPLITSRIHVQSTSEGAARAPIPHRTQSIDRPPCGSSPRKPQLQERRFAKSLGQAALTPKLPARGRPEQCEPLPQRREKHSELPECAQGLPGPLPRGARWEGGAVPFPTAVLARREGAAGGAAVLVSQGVTGTQPAPCLRSGTRRTKRERVPVPVPCAPGTAAGACGARRATPGVLARGTRQPQVSPSP